MTHPHIRTRLGAVSLLALAACCAALPAQAKTFKWSSASDIPTLDIHSQNNGLGNGVHQAIYESLVVYDSKTFKIEPQLATEWKQISPTQTRFTLRQGVKFSDGTPLTAEDVKFSIERAMSKTSNYHVFAQGIEKVEAPNPGTVDIFTKTPNPVLLNQLTDLRVMSKAWAEKHNSVAPKDIKTPEESHAHRNAMGSGPFMVKEWRPDQKLVLVENPNWWGKQTPGAKPGNVTEIVYTPVKAEATRMAALLSGAVDFVLDPSTQDLERVRRNPELKVIEGPENRTIFFGMDQFRDELPGSSVKGKNPLKDKRVRQALYQAIDINAIHKVTMRGLSQNTGTLIAPSIHGWTKKADQRYPYDLAAAKKLLADAGYPNGFEVDFACPNNRYINDERLCQSVTAMWAKIGVKAKLRTLPLVTYFPMVKRNEASIYLLGWSAPTFDALYSLQSLVRTKDPNGGADGNYNEGRYSNPDIDKLVDQIKVETDPAKRDALIEQALILEHQDISHLPLHNQIIPWAARKNIDIIHRPDNRIDWRRLSVK